MIAPTVVCLNPGFTKRLAGRRIAWLLFIKLHVCVCVCVWGEGPDSPVSPTKLNRAQLARVHWFVLCSDSVYRAYPANNPSVRSYICIHTEETRRHLPICLLAVRFGLDHME